MQRNVKKKYKDHYPIKPDSPTNDKTKTIETALNPINDFQTQADEKSRPSRKSSNSQMKPNVEKKIKVGNKSFSLIPNEENIDISTDVAIIENNLKEDLLNSDLMSVHEEKKQRFF